MSYMITKAQDKGYYVVGAYARNEERPILCAGTLSECLIYVQFEFEEKPIDEKPGGSNVVGKPK